MAKFTTMTKTDFLAGKAVHHRGWSRHLLKAEWIEGTGIVVRNSAGEEVHPTYGSTQDLQTCYAHLQDVGFIGGWEYPHKAMPFKYLVESINRGVCYSDMTLLPKRFVRMVPNG